MHAPPSPLVENYLREAGFWHVATVGRGYKVDPKLISALIERPAVCYELLGANPEKMDGGKIEMGWLRDTFRDPDED
ncbi:hypothetical protein Gotur_010274 [Gossypium turneri]